MQIPHHTTLRGCSTCRLMWWAPCAIIQTPRIKIASTPDTPRMSLPTMKAPKAATIVIVISVCVTAEDVIERLKPEHGAWHAMIMLSSSDGSLVLSAEAAESHDKSNRLSVLGITASLPGSHEA